MIGSYEDISGFRRMSAVLIMFTLVLLFYVMYVSFYPILPKNQMVGEMLYKIHGAEPNKPILALLLLLVSSSAIFTHSPSKVIDPKTKKILLYVGLFTYTIFVLMIWLLPINAFVASVSSLVFIIGFFSLLSWRRKVAEDLKEDRRHEVESQFDQLREKIDTPYSINIPYKYSYLGEEYISWMNIVNPFRALLVGGTPGSGKSFATIEDFMRQSVKKGFTGVVYDFKYPTLTLKHYNYLQWYKQNYEIEPSFYVINLDDPEYSNRCNPIGVDSLQSMADAEENTKVLMLNINKTWVDKEGDFFTDSANVFTAMLMWYLKIVTKKYDYDICSLPHLIALSTFESTEILFLILKEYNDLKPKMKPFAEALEKGALEQLAGQTASAGIALSKISTKELNYILTGDDFSLDLNNPLSPKILCVGNNPDRDLVYAAPLGLLFSKLAKTINKKGQLPSLYCIDEFPTVYIKGIDNLIATGRSNLIATVLGFQTFAQINANYGKDISEKLINVCGSRIMGQLVGDDAKKISENIGKHKVVNRSFNYSVSDTSEGHQTAMEDIVPPERITQFSQGTFCGVIADDFKYKESNKVFYGEILPPLDLKTKEEDIPLPKINDFTPDDIDEQQAKYLSDNKEFLSIFKKVLVGKSMRKWVTIIDKTTTEKALNEYLANKYNLEYSCLKKFTEFISFKKQFQKLILEQRKSRSLNKAFSYDEIDKFISQSVRQGIIDDVKDKFLEKHTDEIYNDIYRIIALEIRDLKIVEQIAENKKLSSYSLSFFSRIINSDRFTDEQAKKEYLAIIDELKITIMSNMKN